MPPETSSLRALHHDGRLCRAHVERFAQELAMRHAKLAFGTDAGGSSLAYAGKAGLILENVFLHEGRMTLRELNSSEVRDANPLMDIAAALAELKILGRSDLSHFFMNEWLEHSGRFDGLASLRSQIAREALLFVERQSIARAPSVGESDSQIERALRLVDECRKPTRPGDMMITHGFSGAGKTTAATALAGILGAVVVRNDAELVRLKQDQGNLTGRPALKPGELFNRVESLAVQASMSGWPVIIESCFLDRDARKRFHGKALELGATFLILECSAPLLVIQERLNKRRAFGSLFHRKDASADKVEECLQAQIDAMEPLDEHEQTSTITINTDKQVDYEAVLTRVLELSRAVPIPAPARAVTNCNPVFCGCATTP